jgi:hypothetical protein
MRRPTPVRSTLRACKGYTGSLLVGDPNERRKRRIGP